MSNSEFGSDGQIHPVDEPSAADILRAFEDEHLGPKTPRFQGKVERGHGAPLRFLSDELRREHAALEARSESEKGG